MFPLPSLREGADIVGGYPVTNSQDASWLAALGDGVVSDDGGLRCGWPCSRREDPGGGCGCALQPSALAGGGVHRGLSRVGDGADRDRNALAEKTRQDAVGVPFSEGEAVCQRWEGCVVLRSRRTGRRGRRRPRSWRMSDRRWLSCWVRPNWRKSCRDCLLLRM